MSIELLQEIGLNKYEAEAYYTLLTQGPLTGYELGKRSRVPLSRGYDVLERLCQKGLALSQSGDPVRYKALEPSLFLGQVRSTMEQTLNALTSTLPVHQQETGAEEFWVVRGRQHILTRARLLCSTATHSLCLALPEAYHAEVGGCLSEARLRGCEITLIANNPSGSEHILLLVDRHQALLGTLEPGDSCQAVVSANPALLDTLGRAFPPEQRASASSASEPIVAPQLPAEPDWLDWENRKQQRLRKNEADQRIA